MKKICYTKYILSSLGMIFASLSMDAQTTVASADSLLKAKVDSLHNIVREDTSKKQDLVPILIIPTTSENDQQPVDFEETPQEPQEVEVKQETVEEIVAKADSLRMEYKFREAIQEYERAIAASTDSLQSKNIELKLILGQNGLSMMSYCSQPVVIAKQKFSLKDFFLFYPMKDKSWRATPNQLDSLSSDMFTKATYVPDGIKTLFYSSQDSDGIRNIYQTIDMGDSWSTPELINEELTSSSNEIYPMVSSDGKSLYFASEGLYGMGGYDLYVSRWNRETKDWETPVNMGFPYSSPYDDFLFVNTDDGKYSIFASNRECSRDSVYIYVLEYDVMPVRKSISDVDQLRRLAALSPSVDPSRIDNASAVSEAMPDNAETELYMEKMAEVRELREEIYRYGKQLDEDRMQISSLEGEEKTKLMNDILEREMALPSMNDSLSKAVKSLQQIEMDFLVNGFVIDPDKIQEEAEKEVVGADSGYTFTKKSMGDSLVMAILPPKSNYDYTFMVLPEGRFAEDNTLPSGLVYQIQIFTNGTKATVKDLKGLSPVFEKLNPSLKYTYYAGVFRSYQDALSNLNKAKKAGFKDAFIAAFDNGKSISVKEARSRESQIKTIYTVRVYPDDGQNLPDLAKTAIKQHSDKDIVRTAENGSVVYLAGPFEDLSKAESLVTALKATGVSSVQISSSVTQ